MEHPAAVTTGAAAASAAGVGADLYALVEELYPIPRSLTGDGVRATLEVVARIAPIEQIEVPSGTRVLDWEIPREWNVRDAYVADTAGRRLIDFGSSPLQLVGYSVPVRKRLSLDELRPHLHSLPDHPDWIPYRTSYWQEDWGFCLADETLAALPEGEYEVVIDASLEAGSLTYGEAFVPGETPDEVLVSCHVCHPALCNDGLTGIAVAAFLARAVAARESRRYSYRFLFVPGTIGAIAWLAQHEQDLGRIKHGVVLAGVGDSGSATYKRSRRGDADIDRAVVQVLRDKQVPFSVRDFSPYGYDERQYCSPGFNLPVGCLMRTPYGEYPQYHSSADNLDLVTPAALGDSLDTCLRVVDLLERNRTYVNLKPKGEPQLGRYGLYGSLGGAHHAQDQQLALLWVLNLSDGTSSLLDVAERSGLGFGLVAEAAGRLETAGLLA
jgi:aminopeptidase-like protein